jgi:transposase
MTKTNIADEEKLVLRAYTKTSPLVLVRLKAQAILMASKGMAPLDIGDIIERSQRTVVLWLRDWNKRRLASIFTGHTDNDNAALLTREQKEEIRQALQSPPSDFGLPKDFWDVPQLKQYVEASFGVVYANDRSYHFLLQFSNLSFKYPDTFDRRRNDTLVAERLAAIRREIKPLLHDDRWEIFTVDEVRMEQETITRRAWLRKGERTVLKVNRDKEAQSYIGFLNQKTFGCELFELAWQNQRTVLAALEQFLANHPDKLICIIWDNAPFHRGREIRAALAKRKSLERVHLIALPPYAPDTNPIEHVWNTAKQTVSNIQYPTFADTKQAFRDFVASRLFQYSI